MFNGAADQCHPLQYLSFPLHATPNSFLPFDPYNTSHQLPPHQATHHLHPSHHQDEEEKEANSSTVSSINLEIERGQISQFIDSWTNDEVLALLRISSSMETCFPELTNWDQASRMLAELGFKKSAEKCKEKFEDESTYFHNINYCQSDQFFIELEELCQGDQIQNPYRVVTEKNNQQHEKPSEERDKIRGHVLEEEEYLRNNDPPVTKPCDRNKSDKMVEKSKDKKRKRRDKFEMFKGFCESIVTRMMAQQEEIHNKVLEDMLKRDEEKVAKEEAWKKQEMNRMNMELEMMAQEQAIESDRHANMIEFLKKYAPSSLASQNFNGSN